MNVSHDEPMGEAPEPKVVPAGLREPLGEPAALQSEERVLKLLEETLEMSPADFTEIVWLERRGVTVNSAARGAPRVWGPLPSLLVRVRERQRWGLHRVDHLGRSQLQDSVRLAMAHATIEEPEPQWRLVGRSRLPPLQHADLCQRSLARLEIGAAREFLAKAVENDVDVDGTLAWSEGRVLVVNSNGLRRRAWVTSSTLSATVGSGFHAGTATASSRRLDALQPDVIVGRAKGRVALGDPVEAGDLGVPVVLAPEAVAALMTELLRAEACCDGIPDPDCFLGGLFPGRAFSHLFSLYDDGGERDGLPFPFDLEGRSKARVWLVENGEARDLEREESRRSSSPRRRRRTGSKEPPLAAGGGEDQPRNLFVGAGEASLPELLDSAGTGLWIGGLDAVEIYDLPTLSFRATLRGARRVRAGQLAEPLHPLRWDGSLLELLAGVRGVGRERVCLATGDGIFGGLCTPALLVTVGD